jgi:hypothetical protein
MQKRQGLNFSHYGRYTPVKPHLRIGSIISPHVGRMESPKIYLNLNHGVIHIYLPGFAIDSARGAENDFLPKASTSQDDGIQVPVFCDLSTSFVQHPHPHQKPTRWNHLSSGHRFRSCKIQVGKALLASRQIAVLQLADRRRI